MVQGRKPELALVLDTRPVHGRANMKRRISQSILFAAMLLALISPLAVQAQLQRELLARGFAEPQQFAINLNDARGISDAGVPGLDVLEVKVTLEQGAVGPWHYHPGPALIIVKEGTFKLTQDKEGCPSTEYPAGSVLFEEPFHVHRPSNAGSGDAVIYIQFVVPPDSADLITTTPVACKG
jgi:quercetin dioxygenase-like cupin family protein